MVSFQHRHLLSIRPLSRADITAVLDRAEQHVEKNRARDKKQSSLRGLTLINLFFEDSTRTRTSFELAGKRLGADVINISVGNSSVKKGETLIDTAMTLNAMQPDFIAVRHSESGAVHLLAQKVKCSVINGGDGTNEHPTQALLDALTIRRRIGRIDGLTVTICGDILHSRVAHSNLLLLKKMGATVRVVAPPSLMPKFLRAFLEEEGAEIHHDMRKGLKDADAVMTLRLQTERMQGSYVPSVREYFHYYGLNREKFSHAKPEAIILDPGPVIRGVQIDSDMADSVGRSLILDQVEMGVAVRQAVMELMAEGR
ncbi:MAG: aspartate carbamoyltransferase catalytic subunit [Alphaproteobacteria bacterium]|nr:aspartate carbamoyltransferase catalytic subunit [Alphaproteobacteria bacterium]